MSKSKSKKSLKKISETDVQLARAKKQELAEQSVLRKEICKRIGRIRDGIKEVGLRCVKLVNDSREVGLLIIKDLERLPGKQMTIDFWHKQRDMYVDHHGQPITLENLKWCVKIAQAEPNPITEVAHANSYGKGLLGLIGFNLEGEAPGAAAAEPRNYFLMLTERAPKLAKEIELCIQSLENNPNFGTIESWKPELLEMAITKIEVPWKQLDDIHSRLLEARRKIVEG